jgi:hypothetical protein
VVKSSNKVIDLKLLAKQHGLTSPRQTARRKVIGYDAEVTSGG